MAMGAVLLAFLVVFQAAVLPAQGQQACCDKCLSDFVLDKTIDIAKAIMITERTHQTASTSNDASYTQVAPQVDWTIAYWEQYKKEVDKELQLSSKQRSTLRPKRKDKMVTLYTDASYKQHRNSYSVGCVVKNAEGGTLLQGGERVGNMGTIKAAELMAIYVGLFRAKEKDIKVQQILTDSMEAVAAIKDEDKNFKPEGYIIDRIKELYFENPAWDVLYIPRAKNEEAHNLTT